ncbi:hypothetical protein SELMODRAFT_236645 [Selaginella moellendorffii]|uniref:Peroxidase n=1 Tax=Selaginella moellendorffii TaxID=88036 RepID=D8TBK2_SELML|nr:peroxidase 55 [Selaginella moellendorffii]EFJ05941.1 hypothetical protein SELMODRAFT_236645 [Selaginella moellendorffii]|eukprot:XP_002992995.1 peroxidase 55 [Selaginella moellendorffii]
MVHPIHANVVSWIVIVSLSCLLHGATGQLTFDFYKTSCPNVDAIVANVTLALSKRDNVVAPAVLRLYFHDCLVEGCDASILISSTPTNVAERDAPDNLSFPQNGFDAIVEAKKAVEAACPAVVSCADILAMAARDVVVFSGGPRWAVPKGRRDGLISRAARVEGRLPASSFNVSQLVTLLSTVNLSIEDLVVLSGAHTIGFSHCNQFSKRLYNFSSAAKTDPSLDPTLAASLKASCPQVGGSPNTVRGFDATTPFAFDNSYYRNLQNNRGLLVSDQALALDKRTSPVVASLAASQEDFFFAFMQAMVKLGYTGIKTGSQGEVRRDCRAFNARSNT